MSDEIVLAYDLGGTKVICAAVNSEGEILKSYRELIPKEQGPDAVLQLLQKMGLKILNEYPQIKKGAIASAGPLDPKGGVLIDPTNLTTEGKSWGQWPIITELQKKLNLPLILENDAAAAVQAEYWLGEGRDCKNLVLITLGTGVGVGAICNGELVRSGHSLHPESSHIIVNYDDQTAPCGCGAFGCAEAYLSGKNFCSRLAKKINKDYIKGEDALVLAKQGDQQVIEAFSEYANVMAATLTAYVVLYGPEKIVFAGGFAAATPYFLEASFDKLKQNVARRRTGIDLLPTLFVSKMKDEMVLLGASYIALNSEVK